MRKGGVFSPTVSRQEKGFSYGGVRLIASSLKREVRPLLRKCGLPSAGCPHRRLTPSASPTGEELRVLATRELAGSRLKTNLRSGEESKDQLQPAQSASSLPVGRDARAERGSEKCGLPSAGCPHRRLTPSASPTGEELRVLATRELAGSRLKTNLRSGEESKDQLQPAQSASSLPVGETHARSAAVRAAHPCISVATNCFGFSTAG